MSDSNLDPARQFQIDVLSKLSALQAGLAKSSESFTAQVSTLQTQVSTLQTQVSTIESKVSTIESKVSTIQSTQVAMSEDVADTKARVRTLMSGLSETNAHVTDAIAHVSDAIAQIGTDQVRLSVEIMARIDRLQATIDLVREDARVNWATADTAMSRVKNYRDEIDHLTAMISAMERRHQTFASIVDGLRDRDAERSNDS